MKVKLESDGSTKDFDILKEWQSMHSGKNIILKPEFARDVTVEYQYDYSGYGSGYGGIPESSMCFHASAHLVDSDKVSQIIHLFESITNSGDIQFLKRYFEIKLK